MPIFRGQQRYTNNLSTEDTEGYVEFFGSRDMATFAERLSVMIAAEVDPVTRVRYVGLLDDLFRDLAVLAERVARQADEEMTSLLEERTKRPEYDRGRHLHDAIHSEAHPQLAELGGVGIVDREQITEFDYWKVQEEGSAITYPGFTDRILFGSFIGGEQPDRPRAAYAGGNGPHARYVPATRARGRYPIGLGAVDHHIEPKHFIRDGANRAWIEYVRGIHRISRQYAQRLLRIAGQQGTLRR